MLADWLQWAGDQPPTNNVPLREGKGSLYEGGSRVPLMIRWPGKVSAGTTTDVITHVGYGGANSANVFTEIKIK
jgi:hypothetical protein